jgi:protease PrsW
MNLTILLTFGAPLGILAYVIYSDRFPEPISCILKIFFIGVLLIIPAGYFNEQLINSPSEMFLAGVTEESLKFLAFLLFVSKKFQFDERMDAIVYGVVISLGFATYENYEYVYLYFPEIESLKIATLRVFTAIPMHAICGVIMGYHFGLRYFDNDSSHLWKALFLPMAVHASYNSFNSNLTFTFVFITFAFFYANSLHKEFMSFQKQKKIEKEKKR